MQSKNNILGYFGLFLLAAGLLVWVIQTTLNASAVTPLALGGVLILLYVSMNIGYLSAKLTGRSAVEGANMGIAIVIFLVIVVFLEMLLTRHSTRLDLTQSKKFSLASQTIQMLKGLKEPMTLLYLENPSSPQGTERAKELLELYVHYSNKVNYEIIDPEREPLKVEQMSPVTYGAIYVKKGEKHEKVSPVDENNLTNAFLKLLKGGNRLVYFTTGHDEHSTQNEERDGANVMKQVLEEDGYQVKDLQLYTMEKVPDDALAVIIDGPKKPFFDNEIKALKDYLDYGGKLFALLDPDPEKKIGLESFLDENYGVTLGNDFVLDNNPMMRLFGGSPIAPFIGELGQHEIVSAFGNTVPAIVFEKVQSVTLNKTLPEGITGTEIIKTGPQSWAEKDTKTLLSQGKAAYDEGKDVKGPIPIAVALSKPAKEKVGEATGEKAADAKTKSPTGETNAENEEEKKTPEARLVVFGDSDFTTNRYSRSSVDLFMNSVHWLARQENMISIRPKDDSGQPIFVSQVQANLVFYSSLVIVPACVAIFGSVICVRKRLRG